MEPAAQWPDGRRFAFTVMDDTDCSTLENTRPVYELLGELGLRTTKTIWPLKPLGRSDCRCGTLQDNRYRTWLETIRSAGFEIGFHGASDQPSPRERVIEALDLFRDVFGANPRLHANHVGQDESLYWYHARVAGPLRWLLRAGEQLKGRHHISLGHEPGSPYFWGDIARERLEYVRNFTFDDLNTLRSSPFMPYHSDAHPYVKFWFSATHGSDCRSFNTLINEEAQDRLAEQRGCAIVYTHFGMRFVRDGKIDPRFQYLIRRLSRMDGYFVPVSTLLDCLRNQSGWQPRLPYLELQRLQCRWLFGKWSLHTV